MAEVMCASPIFKLLRSLSCSVLPRMISSTRLPRWRWTGATTPRLSRTASERARVTKVTSTPYRLALVFVTLAPIPFAFTGQPLEVIVAYTIVGSLFVPFLAATLLYLNNRVKWSTAVPHNNLATNALLVVILTLFAIVGGDEAIRALRPFLAR